uniref:Regulator of hemoglobinization and erythroid cell expansion n=1 Tax=Suricata suricatta TaxID=37032 RepID=A0A673T7I0_SURSU
MLTEDMKFWQGLVIAMVSLILQTCLFAAVNYLLSRRMDDSDTSSDSANNSDVSGSSPVACQATKDVNYTQVVFSTPGGLKNKPALDYEDIKETTDYVNVNPKSHRPNFWTSVSPDDSESVEYTQVVM